VDNQTTQHKEKRVEVSIKTNSSTHHLDPNFKFLSLTAKQIAQQLTLIEQMYFQSVNIEEFFDRAWEQTDSDQRAPNLNGLLERFGEVSYWVATEVMTATDERGQPSLKHRAYTISRFIHTINELLFIRNYNTVMQLFAGLNLPIIRSLHASWNLVSREDLELLNKIGVMMGPSDNYSSYRNALDSVIDVPCLPFICLITVDISVIERYSTFVGKKINFEKMGLLANIFSQLQEHKALLYEFKEVSDIQAYLSSKVIKNQKQLEEIYNQLVNEEEPEQLFLESEGDIGEFDNPQEISAMKESLLVTETFDQFHKWLSKVNIEEQHCLECWQAMFIYFKKADFGDSDNEVQALRETAADIFYLYLQEGAPKSIELNIPNLEEINKKISSRNPIEHNLFDSVINECYVRLYDSWKEFSIQIPK
jgi:hypothetical protein